MSGPENATLPLRSASRLIAAACAVMLVAGCGPQAGRPATSAADQGQAVSPLSAANVNTAGSTTSTVTGPLTHETATTAGHYLAARQALYLNDVGKSADFFLQTLEQDTDNAALLRQAFLTQYYYGDIEKAAALGRQLESLNVTVPLGGEPGTALTILKSDWVATQVLADRIAEDATAMQFAGLIRAWALAASGQGDAGISVLLETGRMAVDAETGLPAYFRLHAALMAEYLGLETEARQRVVGLDDANLPAHMFVHLAAFHARQGNMSVMEDIVTSRLSRNFNKARIIANLREQAGTRPNVQELIASGIVAMALDNAESTSSRSLSARLRFALFIHPRDNFARLLLAQQLSDLRLHDRALAQLRPIAEDDSFSQIARLAEASILEEHQDIDAAITKLTEVVAGDPENAYLHHRLGDIHRRNQNYIAARDAYMDALALGRDTGGLHRSLGVALERLGENRAAEVHLLRAIEIDPSDSFALNYLGYWWADEGRNLDQAINMIERAVGYRPESGFFVDSLGWVHFKLGRPERAVAYLERATMLEPADPEITGHLGDVYWVLGRYDEARFKWRLALSLSKDAEEQAMLRERLKSGLSADDLPKSN